MAVSKRTRFEVFRRDDFTCRYCRSKDNPLTIDHVVPTALGGSDDPDNLVTACRDCNAGKSSTSPDEATVADVADDAMRWAKAMRAAADYAASDAEAVHRLEDAFMARWEQCENGWTRKVPSDWRNTITQLTKAGLPEVLLLESIDIAFAGQPRDHWRYFCGVAWKKVDKIRELAQALIDTEDGEA